MESNIAAIGSWLHHNEKDRWQEYVVDNISSSRRQIDIYRELDTAHF